MIRQSLLALAGALLLTTTAATAQSLDYVLAQDERTQLLDLLVDGAGLTCALAEDGPYTVFAPTDNGFDVVPEEALADLRDPDNRELLRSVLTFHIVEGTLTTAALRGAIEANDNQPVALPTLQGDSLQVSMGNERFYLTDGLGNTVNLSAPNEDITADNGVVHLLVGVLMPPEASAFPDAVRDCATE